MEKLLVVAAGLWLLGLFVPWGGPTLRDRLEPSAIPAVMLSGFGVAATIAGIFGLVWLAVAVIVGVWNGTPA